MAPPVILYRSMTRMTYCGVCSRSTDSSAILDISQLWELVAISATDLPVAAASSSSGKAQEASDEPMTAISTESLL